MGFSGEILEAVTQTLYTQIIDSAYVYRNQWVQRFVVVIPTETWWNKVYWSRTLCHKIDCGNESYRVCFYVDVIR